MLMKAFIHKHDFRLSSNWLDVSNTFGRHGEVLLINIHLRRSERLPLFSPTAVHTCFCESTNGTFWIRILVIENGRL